MTPALCRDAAMGPLRELGMAIRHVRAEDVRPVTVADFNASLKTIRASVSDDSLRAYEEWNETFGG